MFPSWIMPRENTTDFDINKKIARLRLGQPDTNEERKKKMYGLFLRLVSDYVDLNTLYAVGRIVNTIIGACQLKFNEKESEGRPNSPVPEIEHRYNVDDFHSSS